MRTRKPTITIEDNIVFLTMDLKGLDLYERGKAIRRFINSDIKIVQDYVDRLCIEIMTRNGINIPSMDKNALKRAFDSLKAKGKDITLNDFYWNKQLMGCQVLERKDYITILLEDNRYILCGVEVREVEKYV